MLTHYILKLMLIFDITIVLCKFYCRIKFQTRFQQVPVHLPVAVHIPSNPARAQRVHRGRRGRVRAVGDDGADRPTPGRRQRRRVRVGPRHEGEAQLGAGEEIYC